MENPEIAEKLVKIILKRTLGHIPNNITIESQKNYNGINTNKHGIHIDVLVKDSDNKGFVTTVYDVEPNAYREKTSPNATASTMLL